MRFPYQKNLGSTLRDFAGVQRHQSYARTLGLSSITKGEGSIDLLPTDDSTTPEASLGDLPDGSQGVGARINGNMVNLATWTVDRTDRLQTAINNEKSRNDSQDTIIANHSGRLDSHASRIGAAENRLTNAEGQISGLRDVATQVLSLQRQVADLSARLQRVYADKQPTGWAWTPLNS
ncbi:hypothetical protein U6G28_02665 [Actinomycetaceae bacterium MB13-C1-2]|nr:hypothetical protein U6G28_02665 [Actinomycetaceae bacterium MB13-C1-2]